VILSASSSAEPVWAQVERGERHWAAAGDIIVLPYGDQHRMGGASDSESIPLQTVTEAPPWRRMPVIRHGRNRSQTDVICGFGHSEDALFDLALRVFPPMFVVRPPDGPGNDWVHRYALAQADASLWEPRTRSSLATCRYS
jgi:hypothetical protein